MFVWKNKVQSLRSSGGCLWEAATELSVQAARKTSTHLRANVWGKNGGEDGKWDRGGSEEHTQNRSEDVLRFLKLDKVPRKSPDWADGVALLTRKWDSNIQDDMTFMGCTIPFFTAWKQEKRHDVLVYLKKPNWFDFIKRLLIEFFKIQRRTYWNIGEEAQEGLHVIFWERVGGEMLFTEMSRMRLRWHLKDFLCHYGDFFKSRTHLHHGATFLQLIHL